LTIKKENETTEDCWEDEGGSGMDYSGAFETDVEPIESHSEIMQADLEPLPTDE
jgi:hypothetical protein